MTQNGQPSQEMSVGITKLFHCDESKLSFFAQQKISSHQKSKIQVTSFHRKTIPATAKYYCHIMNLLSQEVAPGHSRTNPSDQNILSKEEKFKFLHCTNTVTETKSPVSNDQNFFVWNKVFVKDTNFFSHDIHSYYRNKTLLINDWFCQVRNHRVSAE